MRGCLQVTTIQGAGASGLHGSRVGTDGLPSTRHEMMLWPGVTKRRTSEILYKLDSDLLVLEPLGHCRIYEFLKLWLIIPLHGVGGLVLRKWLFNHSTPFSF